MTEMVLVSCSKSKQEGTHRAEDLYEPSDIFRKRRRFRKDERAHWGVLSAKHGYLRPWEAVGYYEKHISDRSPAWGALVLEDLLGDLEFFDVDQVTVLAGKRYVDPIVPELEAHGYDVVDYNRGLRSGERKRALKKANAPGEQQTLIPDGGREQEDAAVTRVLDLYCGHGGVGLALDELDVEFVGVDVEDRSDTYPGEFIQADASRPPLDVDADLVWASPPCAAYSDLSPSHYGSREAAMDANPTIPELRVREIAESLGAEYVIENVPGATREGHLDPTARLNGLAFGKSYDLERHFETSFPVPSAVENGQPETTVDTREDQSVAELAAEKGVPASWGKQGVRSAIPCEFVYWILHYCPSVDAPRPRREQTLLTDGGRDESSAGLDRWVNDIHCVEAVDTLAKMPESSVHCVVTDPPYGLAFMGRSWDDFEPREYQQWCEAWSREGKRVLKPGGHILSFSGSRTFHRLMAGVEDAGIELRDTLMWLYGKGFPKGQDLAKTIDAELGVEGEYGEPKSDRYETQIELGSAGTFHEGFARPCHNDEGSVERNAREYLPESEAAKRFDGFRTDLKPAFEPIILGRAPLSEDTIAANVLEHGTGAINVDGCRIDAEDESGANYRGRYPANVVLDESAAAHLDSQAGETSAGHWTGEDTSDFGADRQYDGPGRYGDAGGPSRFFYGSKASKTEKTLNGQIQNDHPTVKPLDLMEWLVRLVTAEGQVVLDPFAGTGTTCLAAKRLGRQFVGIEIDDGYADVARARVGLVPDDPSTVRPDDDQQGLAAFADGGGAGE